MACLVRRQWFVHSLRLKDMKMKDSKALLLEYLASIRDPERAASLFCGQREVRATVLALARGRSSLPRAAARSPGSSTSCSKLYPNFAFRAGRYSHPHRDAGKKTFAEYVCATARRRCDRQNAPPAVHWVPGGRGWSDQAAARDLQSACDGNRRKLPNGVADIKPPGDEVHAF